MGVLDWLVIAIYVIALVLFSLWVGRGQSDGTDYYVGGRNLPWWAIGISTMATQSSAISFISIPAFVALREDGGLTWLQYELAVPLAMIAVMALLLPFFRTLQLVSVYEYLELRFDARVRTVMSAIFLLSRGLGAGIGLYATALVLAVCLNWPVWATILLTGVVTLVYDTLGGMKAVVYSDVAQMFVLLFGLGLCIYFALDLAGGYDAAAQALPPDRLFALDPGTGIGDGSSTPFWGFLIGGFCLYVSYYGVDQTQVQRELSAPTVADTNRSLVLNGLARFPLTALYLAAGLAAAAAYFNAPELAEWVPADEPDRLIPTLVLLTFPDGLRGLVFAAILAAAMSSLDSSLNSLSAATMRDFVERRRALPPGRELLASKLTTVAWGFLITGFAFLVGDVSATVIEGINLIGSTFYGPILAAFLTGLLWAGATGTGVLVGTAVGVALNLGLWLGPVEVHFMWWNFTGLVAAVIGTVIASRPAEGEAEARRRYTLQGSGILAEQRRWWPWYLVLAVYFLIILATLQALNALAIARAG